jgi:Integrase core domain
MQCVLHKIGDTIYWLEACTSDKHRHFTMPTTIYKVDYDLMHKRMGHPSMDVLCNAKNHTKGFPNDIIYPEETPLCWGCAQGKMPSASFPSSQSHASRPYEKVHSDVKSFPVASYCKAQYFISFLDDYTSHATVVLINKKSSVIVALKQFLSYIETQFNVTVKEWMSNAGGEYKSEAFDAVLCDKGIRILQSVPHTPNRMDVQSALIAL